MSDLTGSRPGWLPDAAVTALLGRLITSAGLPAAVRRWPVAGTGFDNQLVRVELADRRMVLLRIPVHDKAPLAGSPAPWGRDRFLAANDVGAPRLLAAADGAVLMEWADGEPLADLVDGGRASAYAWRSVGRALARVHAVRFPATSVGRVGPERVALEPVDPVADLLAGVDGAADWVAERMPHRSGDLTRLRDAIPTRAELLRAEPSCLLHADVNLDNVVVGPDGATLIDWDIAGVGPRAHELAAFEEHAWLHGLATLPAPFWDGYGTPPHPHVLALHREVGCLGWLAGEDWSDWQAQDLTPARQARMTRWHERLVAWVEGLPDRLDRLDRLDQSPDPADLSGR